MGTTDLLNQFNSIKDKMKLIEIEHDSEFYIYELQANEKELYSGSLVISWDDCFTLDDQLQALYDLIYFEVLKIKVERWCDDMKIYKRL